MITNVLWRTCSLCDSLKSPCPLASLQQPNFAGPRPKNPRPKKVRRTKTPKNFSISYELPFTDRSPMWLGKDGNFKKYNDLKNKIEHLLEKKKLLLDKEVSERTFPTTKLVFLESLKKEKERRISLILQEIIEKRKLQLELTYKGPLALKNRVTDFFLIASHGRFPRLGEKSDQMVFDNNAKFFFRIPENVRLFFPTLGQGCSALSGTAAEKRLWTSLAAKKTSIFFEPLKKKSGVRDPLRNKEDRNVRTFLEEACLYTARDLFPNFIIQFEENDPLYDIYCIMDPGKDTIHLTRNGWNTKFKDAKINSFISWPLSELVKYLDEEVDRPEGEVLDILLSCCNVPFSCETDKVLESKVRRQWEVLMLEGKEKMQRERKQPVGVLTRAKAIQTNNYPHSAQNAKNRNQENGHFFEFQSEDWKKRPVGRFSSTKRERVFTKNNCVCAEPCKGNKCKVEPELCFGQSEDEVEFCENIFGCENTSVIKTAKDLACASFSTDGKYVAFAYEGSKIEVWDIRNRKTYTTFESKLELVQCITFYPNDHSQLVCGGLVHKGKARLYRSLDYMSGCEILSTAGISTLLAPNDGEMGLDGCSIRFNRDGSCFVFASGNGIQIYKNDGSEFKNLNNTLTYVSASFNPDSSRVVCGSSEFAANIWGGNIFIYDTKSNIEYKERRFSRPESIQTLSGHTKDVLCVLYSPDGSCIVSGSGDKTLKIWDTKTGAVIHTLRGHQDEVVCVLFSSDGAYIISGSRDKTLKLWNSKTGELVQSLGGHESGICNIWFSPDNKRIMSLSSDYTLKTWALCGDKLKIERAGR